jgi:peptide/nickel transport system permease protein
VIVFVAIRAVPGSPAQAILGENNNPHAVAVVTREFGFDKPLPVQYVDWVGQLVRGNLGTSPTTGNSVTSEIAYRVPVTLELTILAMIVALLLAIPTGVMSALRRGKSSDYIGTAAALFGLSIPSFWFGIVLILLLAVHFSVLPASGFVAFSANPVENLKDMAMPAFVLGTGLGAVLMRQMRSGMLETLRADYVRTARAKGVPEWLVIGKHALRNSLITVTTVVGLQFGVLLSGVAVTEQVFLLPGLGQLTIESVFQRDYPTVQGIALLTAAIIIVVNLATDLAYAILNPKVRLAGGSG